jgi:hypothetical protein
MGHVMAPPDHTDTVKARTQLQRVMPSASLVEIHPYKNQFASLRASFSSCCQPRMLPATHALLNRPPARLADATFAQPTPPRVQPVLRLLCPSHPLCPSFPHTGQGVQCLMR